MRGSLLGTAQVGPLWLPIYDAMCACQQNRLLHTRPQHTRRALPPPTFAAWRPLPLAALARLQVTPRCSFPFEKLAACAALRHISVQTNRCAAWRGALDALMRARAPALRRLAVEFWGGEDPGMLDDLAAAMQVRACAAPCVLLTAPVAPPLWVQLRQVCKSTSPPAHGRLAPA